MVTKNKEVEEIEEVFEYLDGLRESGVTNMFGARPYVEEEFSFGKQKAGDLLSKWMKSFDGKTSALARAEKVFADELGKEI